jgi:septum formation topological specificity factor MinE
LLDFDRVVSETNLLPAFREEILTLVSRYVTIDPDKAHVWVDCGDKATMLVVGLEIPKSARKRSGSGNARILPNDAACGR